MTDKFGVRDARLLQKAAEQRWPISDQYRSAAVTALMRIVADPESTPRAVTSAVKALIAMDALNLKHEQLSQLQSDRNRFLALAERLGIGEDVARVTEDGAGGDSVIVDGATVERAGEGRGEEASEEE